jgi:hypothetical protein
VIITPEERLARIEERLVGLASQLASVLVNQGTQAAKVEELSLAKAKAEGAVAGGRLVAGLAGGLTGGGLVGALSKLLE